MVVQIIKNTAEVPVLEQPIVGGKKYMATALISYSVVITEDEIKKMDIPREEYIELQIKSMVSKLGEDLHLMAEPFRKGDVKISLMKEITHVPKKG